MKWILIANTGNYPTTNYVEWTVTIVALIIIISGIRGIIRGSRKKEIKDIETI